ncbi:unnamed protein product [Bemisia tabaci]|uniref:Uncharacterized protein n=1 Tax=Bemisia tabaci TaxID=7038 RepID=A0A9P0AH15_BEMTA|nr:unnamed protein product [Bemisia tabaci]
MSKNFPFLGTPKHEGLEPPMSIRLHARMLFACSGRGERDRIAGVGHDGRDRGDEADGADRVRAHLPGGAPRERDARAHLRAAPVHAQRAQHLHREPGPGRPPRHRLRGPLHDDHLHLRRVALRPRHLPPHRDHQGHLHRRVRLHADRPLRREVLHHRRPHQETPVLQDLDHRYGARHMAHLHHFQCSAAWCTRNQTLKIGRT